MPELPEVETVLRTLELKLGKSTIEKVEIVYPKLIENVSVEFFEQSLKNQTIQKYERLGKYMLFILDDYCLIAHMRMEGKFYVQKKEDPFEKKHTHAFITFTNGVQLRYHDTRKFGRMYLYSIINDETKRYDALKNIGYDAMDEQLSAAYLYHCIHNKHRAIKTLLLDQSIIAGIGNIYADEICFSSSIHPLTLGAHLSLEDCETLLFHTRRILQGAINFGGTTIRSYTSSLGVSGRFQLKLKVHSRVGQPCPICFTTIKKIKINGRGSEYCEKCQVIK